MILLCDGRFFSLAVVAESLCGATVSMDDLFDERTSCSIRTFFASRL